MIKLVAVFLFAIHATAMPRKPRIDKSMETEGSYCKVATPGHRVVESEAQWAALWKEIGSKPPRADFSKSFAVGVFAGTRHSGGFAIRFDEPRDAGDALIISYRVVGPKGMATMALTQPYAVRLFPKTTKRIRVEGRDE